MRYFFFPFLAVLLLGTSQLSAQLPLNPLKWFNQEQEPENLPLLGEIEQSEARIEFLEAREKYQKGQTWRAKQQLKSITKKYSTTPSAGDALALRGQIFLENGRYQKAFKDFQRVINEHPKHPDFNGIISLQFQTATSLMDGARGKILWIIPGFKQYGEAVSQFESIVNNAPYGNYAPLALMNVALVSIKQDNPEIAIDALDRLINYYPQSMLASDAYYNLADVYAGLVQGSEYDQGSTRRAVSYYEDFLILYPSNTNVGEVEANMERMENLLSSSRKDLGDFYYFYRNNNTAALTFYNEAITIAPNSESADEARKLIEDINAGVRPTTGSSILSRLLTGK